MNTWHILTCEYPPEVGGVSDYTKQVAEALAHSGDEVHVWCPARETQPTSPRVRVHPEMGRFRPSDLRRVGVLLSASQAPRRLLVQWVPHGYGYRSMNLWFCLWLANRALTGDSVELMVHEPFIELRRGPLRHLFIALVHRVMTVVLMSAATRVWVSIPAWEPLLRAYALGRRVPIGWLPIPGCVGSEVDAPTASIKEKYAEGSKALIGHFGSYGREVSAMLEARLLPIMSLGSEPALLLIGARSEAFRSAFVARYPAWTDRVHATGYVAEGELAHVLDACDLMVQPYPDGVSSRRTSVMACLSHGRPVVTTSGHLTEPLWAERGAVVLADVSNATGFVSGVARLLDDPRERIQIGGAGQRLYRERFDVNHTVAVLRAA